MIETYILKNLVAFADYGTLVATSEKVNITQPSITRSFQKLEQDLGIPLFDRTKNTIALNATGNLAVKYARKILLLQKEMETKLQDFYKKTIEIKIGSIAPMPLQLLTELLSTEYPKTKITGELCEENEVLFTALEKDKFQIIVTTQTRFDERFYSQEFFEEHLKLFIPKTHKLATRKSVCLKDLAGETFIMLSDLGFWKKIKTDLIPNAKFIEQNDIEGLKDIVENSTLPAFVTDFTEKSDLLPPIKKANRIAIPITDEQVNVKFYAVCRVEMMRQLKQILQ
ncbi:LysR family transcriptional regulator [Treponema pectinovorum]|uniref:LysR family transcriptional regulator n=1 Tax=Treponema pectinovorum TaxID=164 RepID=UPI00164D80BB|nr:LysR family transcriptional regulator [Treponema pectinovorum]